MCSISVKLSTFLVLLLFVHAVLASQLYVADLEGNGQITLERQHFDIAPPAEVESLTTGDISRHSAKHCNSINHVALPYLSRKDAFNSFADLIAEQTVLAFFGESIACPDTSGGY